MCGTVMKPSSSVPVLMFMFMLMLVVGRVDVRWSVVMNGSSMYGWNVCPRGFGNLTRRGGKVSVDMRVFVEVVVRDWLYMLSTGRCLALCSLLLGSSHRCLASCCRRSQVSSGT